MVRDGIEAALLRQVERDPHPVLFQGCARDQGDVDSPKGRGGAGT
jgi:hypothetical protein